MPVCNLITDVATISDLLVWPTLCFYHFYTVVLGAIFMVITLSLYFIDKEKVARPDIISSMGVSSIAVFFLAMVGTLISNSDGIPLIQRDIFLYFLSFAIIFIIIWFFKK